MLNIVVYFYQLNYAAPLGSQENNLLLFVPMFTNFLTGIWCYPVSKVLHSGGMHLALNTLALFVIGIECERTYGKRVLAIYLFSVYWRGIF